MSSIRFLDAACFEKETVIIDPDVAVPVPEGLEMVIVQRGRVLPVKSPSGSCKVINGVCEGKPTCLVGLEEENEVILVYKKSEEKEDGQKKPRLEMDTETMVSTYGEKLMESLQALKGLKISLCYKGHSVEGTIASFSLAEQQIRRAYPLIVVHISVVGKQEVLTHIQFTRELQNMVSKGAQLSFWGQAKIKQGDKWFRIGDVLPLPVRCFTDPLLLEHAINRKYC